MVRSATWRAGGVSPRIEGGIIRGLTPPARPVDCNDTLRKILASYNVCSKEWIIRQYDHEVQGGSVLKPLVGVREDGPGDAAVVTPVLGSWQGLAVGCGINPRYGDLDPYAMAAAAVDEAVRNVVAVGADPARIALLDNFCWGNTDRPEVLGSLVRRPRPVATWRWRTVCHSSVARTVSRMSFMPATVTSSFRRLCSSAPWARCRTCAAASAWT